jgi:hypothetical protein
LIFWFRVQDRRPPVAVLGTAVVLLAYGTLVRKNAIFGFPPLLLYTFVDLSRIRAWALVVTSCLLAAVTVPASSFFNRELLGAAPTNMVNELLIYDVAGVARHAEDNSLILPKELGSQEEYARCYTPITADSFMPWGKCPFLGELQRPPIIATWLDAVTSHPAAYLVHRLKHFNSEVLFFVPAFPYRFLSRFVTDPLNQNTGTKSQIAFDYVRKNPLIWPVTWISLGLCAAALLWQATASAMVVASRVLLASGLFYSFGYLLVGIASDIRYYIWSIMAVMAAVIIGYPVIADRLHSRPSARLLCSIVVVIVVLGLYARLTDNSALLF